LEELNERVNELAILVEKYKQMPMPPDKEIGWYVERKRDELVSKLYKSIRELEQLKFE
jgi:hypothetical protein